MLKLIFVVLLLELFEVTVNDGQTSIPFTINIKCCVKHVVAINLCNYVSALIFSLFFLNQTQLKLFYNIVAMQ
jgi:hypothetical protein